MADSPLHAVHDDDLTDVLESLGLAKAFARGELSCHFCGSTITWENLSSLFPEGGQIKLVCDKPDCENRLLRYLDTARE